MSLLFETVRCQNRQLFNLEYHNQRLNQSRFDLLKISQSIDLKDFITIPDWVDERLHRCRVSYAEEIQKVEFFEYKIKHPKRIGLIEAPQISYSYKYEDRSIFQELLNQNQKFDDVIILQNGYLTDSTYANLAFFDGDAWFTPKTYLLKGTKRNYLIDNQQLIEIEIQFSDLKKFQKIALFNAMRGLEMCYEFEVLGESILCK
jgi:4-amino-4-deoxychorismate lyase